MATLISHTMVDGHRAVVLEDGHTRAVVLPGLGGRVWELHDLARGVQWVWHRPGVPLAAPAAGAEYDAVWAGGWEELFPNDAAGLFESRQLPDHGEWWSLAWKVEAIDEGPAAVLRLGVDTTVRRCRCTKEFRLLADRAGIEVRYRIESREDEPFHFLFKQHLPLQLAPGLRLVAPGGTVVPVDPTFGSRVTTPGPHRWPFVRGADGGVTDLRVVHPASAREQEFIYVSDLPAAWCGADDAARGASLRMHWDQRQLPFLWFFVSYGGWRDVHTVVLEPCSNLPKDLTEAVRRGQAATLGPRGTFETRVRVVLSSLADAEAAGVGEAR